MKRQWDPEELIEQWTLLPVDHMLLANKTGPTRLGFAVLLLYFQHEGRFPQHRHDVPRPVVRHVAAQVAVPYEEYLQYDWSGRSIKYHRAQIREALGFREATVQDADDLTLWLRDHAVGGEPQFEAVTAAADGRLRSLKVEPPTSDRMGRIVRSAIRGYEELLCARVAGHLSPDAAAIDALLAGADDGEDAIMADAEHRPATAVAFLDLKADPGRVGLDSMLQEMAKLRRLRQIALPTDLVVGVSPKLLRGYRDRIAAEPTREVRRHAPPVRLTLMAAFCMLRSREITDSLVDLLIGIVHKIGVRAEQRVDKVLLEDFKRVTGKTGLLYRVAEASLAHPDEYVRDVIYPVANEETLRDLVREYKATGRADKTQVHTVMRRSYGGHSFSPPNTRSRNFGDMALIKTLLYTGVRVSDLVNIWLSEVDLDRCQIRVTQVKGKKDRVVPFPDAFKETLGMHVAQMQKQGATHLFESSRKKRYSDRGVRRMLERYADAAKLGHNISPHQLRHFLFTWLKKQGLDDALIQPYSGHASRQSLEIYSRLAIGEALQEYEQVIGRFPV